jgi:hypothetical protein
MSERQRETLRALEQDDGLSASDVLRRLVNDEGRRRGGARTWLMRDFSSVLESKWRATLLSALLCRLAREAGERFEASVPPTVRVERFESRGSSAKHDREEATRAVLYFDEIKLPNGESPAVALRAVQSDGGFRVDVGGPDHGDEQPGLSVEFPLHAETPPELFRALFECALHSAANSGKVIR